MTSQPHHHHLHAQTQDPTKTKTIRQTYAQRLRGAFGRINATIRKAIVEDDIFGLRDGDLGDDEVQDLVDTFASKHQLVAVDEPPDLNDVDPDQQIERFEEWLNEAQESEVLDIIERDENVWVRRSYERGLEDADSKLQKAGVAISAAEGAETIRMPVHERKLQVLFSRNYSQLKGITNAVSQQVTREIADAISEGVNPTETARRITKRVDKIGKTRATVLARTETINAHSQATVERYRQQGVDTVGLEPEVKVQTAGDQRVCQQCADAAGRGPWSLDDFEGSEFQPPLHPQCRCSVLPILEG